MTPSSELIWRNLARLQVDEPLLLLAPAPDELGVRLRQAGHHPTLLCLSFAAHRNAELAELDSRFGLVAEPGAAGPLNIPRIIPRIIIFQPREKALLELLLDLARALLAPDGTLWLVGENRAGIKSAGKRLSGYFAQWRKLDSARHCTLFRATSPLDGGAFDLERHVAQWPLQIAGKTLRMHSLPGVFAHGRLDAGTQLLLETLHAPPLAGAISGKVLDFACGSGVIAVALGASNPETELTLLDDSALALESARRSLDANGLRGRLVASDGLAALLNEADPPRYDWIVSNPPFHRGVRQSLDTAHRFLSESPHLLTHGGRLCLVANAHLPYAQWLSELYGKVQVISADREYNVWLAHGPPSRSRTQHPESTRKT